MPYYIRAQKVASDHAVVAKAIDVWMSEPNNAVGLTSPTLAQIQKAITDHFNEMFNAAVRGLAYEGPGIELKIVQMIKAARYAFEWHVQNEDAEEFDAEDFVEISELTINNRDLDLTWGQSARLYFALTKILLVSSALSLEDVTTMVNSAMIYQATAVGEQDNRHEIWLGYAGMLSSFILWVSDWRHNGSPRVEWRESEGFFEKASLVIKHIGFLGEQISLGALGWYGGEANASTQIQFAGKCLLAATVLKHNKAVVLQIRKGIDISFKIVLVLITLCLWGMLFGLRGLSETMANPMGFLRPGHLV